MQPFKMRLPKSASSCLVKMVRLTNQKAAEHKGLPSVPFAGLFAV